MLFPKFYSGLMKCVWNCLLLILSQITINKYDSLLQNNIIPENIIQYLQFKLIICISD